MRREKPAAGDERYATDLDSGRTYRVIMARLEWDTRFLRLAEKIRERDPAHPLAVCRAVPGNSPVDFTTAVCEYLKSVLAGGSTVEAEAARLSEIRKR